MEFLISFSVAVPQAASSYVPTYELEDQDKEQTVTAQLRQSMASMKELMVWETLSSHFSLLPGPCQGILSSGCCPFVKLDRK